VHAPAETQRVQIWGEGGELRWGGDTHAPLSGFWGLRTPFAQLLVPVSGIVFSHFVIECALGVLGVQMDAQEAIYAMLAMNISGLQFYVRVLWF